VGTSVKTEPELREASSLWLATTRATRFARLEGTVEVDVAVVGGGITGVTAAHLLKEAGRRVALVELGRIGEGTSGHTTAKLTVGQSLVYRRLLSAHGEEAARRYAESNRSAIALIGDNVRRLGIDCDWETASNYVYTRDPERVRELEEEAEAASSVGVQAELTTETDLPFPVSAAVRVDGQAQLHPLKYLQGLVEEIPGDGSHVFESTRALGVDRGETSTVETSSGKVLAGHVVVATQLPFLGRGLFFAKAPPWKSYAVAAPIEESRAPRGMYISVESPTRSIRSAPSSDGSRHLIVGGESGKPGDGDADERYAALESFIDEEFGLEPTHRWSAHDFVPVDGLPYIGHPSRRDDRVYVATGFAKWGLTNGTAAAGLIADSILGRPDRSGGTFDARRRTGVRASAKLVKVNAGVARRFVGDRMKPRDGRTDVDGLAPGEGAIVRRGLRRYAVSRDESGVLQVVSARCTHLGCLVGWNGVDRAWECPCHGSRFAPDGSLLQGPATRDLEPRSL
jgi:glycine/D-amino acid oxidase-like deaminating enzyme/nitrite reductase/ring-hydroxylating ferredoxin subunit